MTHSDTAVIELGAQPLPIRRQELYARARSLGESITEAGKNAGYKGEWRNAAKLEHKPHVQGRIAYLKRQEEEVLKVKREKIEERLWLWHDMSYASFFDVVDETTVVLDKDGDTHEETRRVQKLKLFDRLTEDQERCIESLRFTEKGKPILETYSRMQANIELRKLLGLGAQERSPDDARNLSDNELAQRVIEGLRELGLAIGEGLASATGQTRA
jgi:hypothetical protein